MVVGEAQTLVGVWTAADEPAEMTMNADSTLTIVTSLKRSGETFTATATGTYDHFATERRIVTHVDTLEVRDASATALSTEVILDGRPCVLSGLGAAVYCYRKTPVTSTYTLLGDTLTLVSSDGNTIFIRSAD